MFRLGNVKKCDPSLRIHYRTKEEQRKGGAKIAKNYQGMRKL